METRSVSGAVQEGQPENGHILVVGHPIAKSVTPHFHRSVFKTLGISWSISLLDTTDTADLQAAVAKPGFRGAAVSLPLKDAVAPLLNRVEKDAQILGSVNTIFVRQIENIVSGKQENELVGGNSDWTGMQSCISAASLAGDRSGRDMVHDSNDGNSSKTGLVVGSGVLSSTAVYAVVVGLGVRNIYLTGCPEEHANTVNGMLEAADYAAETKVTRLTSDEEARTCKAESHVIIHAARASPAGDDSKGQQSQRIAEHFLAQRSPGTQPRILLDMAFNGKDETELTIVARNAGWQTLSFLDFMAHQAIRQNAYWTGASPESFPSITRCREILEEGT
jgi:shikimate 5-dehydrogenase